MRRFSRFASIVFLWVGSLHAENELQVRLLQLADARQFDAETFLAAAESSQVADRLQCARILGHLRKEEAVRLALRLARDAVGEVRAEALASLGRLLPWFTSGPVHQRALKVLFTALSDPDPKVIHAAAWGLAAAGEGASTLLAALERKPDSQVRAVLLQQLWRFKGVNWAPVAARYAKSSDVHVRRAAVFSLARAGVGEAIDTFAQALRDPDPQVRLLACEGVRRHKLAALARDVVPLLEDSEDEVRVAAVEALAVLGSAAEKLPNKMAKTLARWVASEDLNHPYLRIAAIRLAGALGCCREELLKVLDEGGWAAGEALVALALQGVREPVERELDSGDPFFRQWAVRGLAHLPKGEELLLRAFSDSDISVRLAAAEVAGKIRAKSLIPGLKKLLQDADGAVRVQACESLDALGARPDAETLSHLLERALKERGGDAPIALIRFLGQDPTLSPGASSALEKARLSQDFAVAQAAWEELARHKRVRAFPARGPSKPLGFYKEVNRFASKPHYLEVVTVRGTFTVALDVQAAPLASFALCELANRQFFNNLTFHRVVANFVVQGGDPRGDGWGGPGFFLRDELSLEEFDPGAVGLALAGPDTGGSQFFVTLTRQPHLDGYYPQIGHVVAGIEVVRRLQQGDRIIRVTAGEGEPPEPIPVWYGPLSVEKLEQAIPEFKLNRKSYEPASKWLDFLKQTRGRYALVVVMGTWCSDSREQVPRLFKVLDELGSSNPFTEVTLTGVDRSKKVVPVSTFPYGLVERVPTIVVTMEGSEVGRIVERPLSPSLEEDLVRILAPLEGWDVPEG